ncbi:MAG: RDD family protein [Nitrospirae bacterium]|nr:RDD family protein [Nitrospirota bacterium]
MEETTGEAKIYPRANIVNRFIAKFIDTLIAAALYKMIPPVGFFAGLLYIIIADGFYEGQSIGKKLIGLRTILLADAKKIGFKDSVIRNMPFAIAYGFFLIPYLGWLFSLLIIGLEGILIIGNEKGSRIGDEIAKTQVVDYNKE